MNGVLGVFPREIILEFFSHLSFEALNCQISLVSQTFKSHAEDPFVMKRVIYREKTFNPDDWAYHLGISALELNKAFESLPLNIGQVYKGNCPIYSRKKLGQTHRIVWIPEHLSLNKYGKLLKEKFPLNLDGYEYIWSEVEQNLGNIETKSEWVMMTYKTIPDTENKQYMEQQAILNCFKNYTVPTSLEAIICISTAIFKEEMVLFHGWYVRCQEEIFGYQVAINFWPNSFYILPSPKKLRDDHVAIAALTRL